MRIKVNFKGSNHTFKPRFQSLQIVDNTRYPVIQPLNVTENGEYSVPEGVDGFNPVKVETSDRYEEGIKDGYAHGYEIGYPEGYAASQNAIVLQEKTTSENGEITADEGFTGLSKVNVNVPKRKEEQTKVLDITENGTFVIKPDDGYALEKAEINVSVQGDNQADAVADDTIVNLSLPTAKSIRQYFCANARFLVSVSAPMVETVYNRAFSNCTKLTDIYFPKAKSVSTYSFQGGKITEAILDACETIEDYAFSSCKELKNARFAALINVSRYAFMHDVLLQKIDLGNLVSIPSSVFYNCQALTTVILRKKDTICVLENIYAFSSTPYAVDGSGGIVYVPSALISEYQTATNWSSLYEAGTCTFVPIEGSEYE